MAIDRSYWPGITASFVSSIGFATMDAISKVLLESVNIVWVLVLRSGIIAILVALLLVVMRQAMLFKTAAPRMLLLRSAVFGITSVMVVAALKHLSLAETISLYFLSPIFTVFFSAWLLEEPITIRALAAAVLGFVGVVLITQPTSTRGFSIYYLLPLIAGATGALQDVLVRRMRAQAHPSTIVFYGMWATIIVSFATLPIGEWRPLASRETLLVLAGALAGVIGFFFVAVSFQRAPTRIIAPLRYLNIVWAVVLGLVIWGSGPDALALLGTVLIIVAGITCVWSPARPAER